MPILLTIAGFLGAWALVAGPVYQASIELRGEQIDQTQIRAAAKRVPQPSAGSAWWWLVPPVAFMKHRRANLAYQQAVRLELPRAQLEQWVHFSEKATGWLTVGAGGTLLALVETWELVEALHWEPWLFWPIAVVAFLLCAANTALQSHRAQSALPAEAPEHDSRT